MSNKKKFGIVVSGGPAPGINCVISSAVIEANKRGYEVLGFKNGFKDFCEGVPNSLVPLDIETVSRIYQTGGSLLGTSRFNPLKNQDHTDTLLRGLNEANIDKLIVIGGEGSAYLSYHLSKSHPDVKFVHVPKTIDNDLILPNDHPSFGFETARSVGTEIMDTLMVDAKTTQRWFIVTTMGRKAGFLALGLGMASRSTITLIPEEFETKPPAVSDVATIIFNSMKKRLKSGKQYGVAVLAEGVMDKIDINSDPQLKNTPQDELGRLRYSEIELGELIIPYLRKRCAKEKLKIQCTAKNIGYELRCHAPVSFDIEYTTFLGFGAVKHIDDGRSGIMVVREFDKLSFQKLDEMVQWDGTIRSRKVDLDSDVYKIARSFMIR